MSKKTNTSELVDLVENDLSDKNVEIVDLDTESESVFKDTDTHRIVRAKLAILLWQRSLTKERLRRAGVVASILLALVVILANFHTGITLFNGLVFHLQFVFFP